MNKLLLLLIAAVCTALSVTLVISLKKKSRVLTAVCALLATAATVLAVCSLAGVGTGGSDKMITSYVTVGKYKTTEMERLTRSTKNHEASSKAADTQSAEQQTASGDNANHETVYITKNGKKYHYSYTCGKGTYYECPYEEALKKGYEPCQKCVK
ncbi:MAG: hypothetical protein PUG56_07180 [Ruminococcus sp.]|nr:hypothetical protein [Ruminococcus sp.]